jgi:MFS family permease
MSSFSRDDRAVELSAVIPNPDPYIARANGAANVVTAADDIVPSATSLIPNLVPDSGRAAVSSVSAAEAAAPAVALAQVPDGGWGWIVTLSCFFMHLVVLGSIYSFGVFLPVYVIEFSQGRGAVSWVGSVGAAGFVAFALPTTFLVQRFGARVTTAIGGVLVGGGLLIASYATELWHLYLTQGILVGFGYAFIMLPSLALVNVYFRDRRGLAVGLAASGSGIGQMAIAPWTAQLLLTYGWRTTLQINAAIFFGVSMLAALPLVPCPGAPASHPDIFVGARKNKRGFLVLVIGFDICMFGFLFPFAHLPQYATQRGISKANSAVLLTIMGASSAAGRVLFGLIADRIGRLLAFKISVVLSALSVYFWLLCGDNFDMMAAFSALYGCFGGSVLGLLTVVVADVMGVVRCTLPLMSDVM